MAAAPTQFPTLYVTPAGFKWSAEAANKAAQKGQFIRVSQGNPGKRSLSGANRTWASTDPSVNQTVFSTQYRISGTPDNIRQALRYANVPEEQINQVLATAITKDNFQTTMKAAYDQEIANYQNLKGNRTVTQGYELPQIIWFAQNIKKAVASSKTGEQKGTGTAGTGRGTQSLSERLAKLPAGKVIDVSNMDTNTGKGYTTIAKPKSDKGGKVGGGRVPIVSNNIEKYVRALQFAYGANAEQTYASEIDMVRNAIDRSKNVAPTAFAGVPTFSGLPTVQTRPASPLRVPGASLAPAPVFAPAVPTVATPPRVGTVGGANYPAIPSLNNLLQPVQ